MPSSAVSFRTTNVTFLLRFSFFPFVYAYDVLKVNHYCDSLSDQHSRVHSLCNPVITASSALLYYCAIISTAVAAASACSAVINHHHHLEAGDFSLALHRFFYARRFLPLAVLSISWFFRADAVSSGNLSCSWNAAPPGLWCDRRDDSIQTTLSVDLP